MPHPNLRLKALEILEIASDQRMEGSTDTSNWSTEAATVLALLSISDSLVEVADAIEALTVRTISIEARIHND